MVLDGAGVGNRAEWGGMVLDGGGVGGIGGGDGVRWGGGGNRAEWGGMGRGGMVWNAAGWG